MHVIAAKAVAFKEAESGSFKEYQARIIKNSKALAKHLAASGFRVVSGGTDNHLSLIDLSPKSLTGKIAEEILDKVNITVNKNLIPFDRNAPMLTSGIRLGTPAVTTRGMNEPEMREIADIINKALMGKEKKSVLGECARGVSVLVKKFPLYPELG